MRTLRLAAWLVPLAMAALAAGCQSSPIPPGQGTAGAGPSIEPVAPHPLTPAFEAFLEGEKLSQASRLRASVTAFDLAISLQPDIAEFQRRRDETIKRAAPKEAALQKAEAQPRIVLINFEYGRARALRDLGEHDEAIEAFQTVLAEAEKPTYAKGDDGRGALYLEFGDMLSMASRPAEAVRAYDRGLTLNPTAPVEAYLNRGKALLRLGERERALAAFETLLPRTNQLPFANAMGQLLRAVALQQLGHAEAADAFDEYRDAVFAEFLRRDGFLDEALAAYDNVLGSSPARGPLQDLHIGRGLTLMDLGRHEEAVAAFANAVEALRQKMFLQIIHRHRGDALAHLGRYEEALAAYQDASVAAERYPLGNTK